MRMKKDRDLRVTKCDSGFIVKEVECNSTWDRDRVWAFCGPAQLAVFIEDWANGKHKIQPENELDEGEEA